VVWFKRDLRLQDNEAVSNALKSNKPTLLLYVFEPSLENDGHYSKRHWDFIKQSLVDINDQLLIHNSKVLIVSSETINAFNIIQEFYKIDTVFSHQETGLKITYELGREYQ
jgi:deoxyribodipyrimidine photo-lyase